jgi:hypothetical protein
MRDVTTVARGPRARAERRRAEKAERRRLAAAEAFASADAVMDDLTDPTPTNLTDTALGTPPRASLAPSTEASHAEPARTASTDQADRAAGFAQIGLVAGIQRGGELSVLLDAATHRAKLSHELLQHQVAVAVGDRVRLVQEKDDRHAVIGIEPRRTRLARIREDRARRSGFGREEAVLAANVDVAVIVAAVAQPPFHPKLVD